MACFKTEDKYSDIIKQIETEWKSRENALTREIFHLSADREEMTKQLSLLKQADMEKAAIIRNLNLEHEKSVKEMIESSKQEQSKEYTKFKSLEKYAQDKESELTRLQSKHELIKVEKEILEKQIQNLKKTGSSPDSSPNVPRIMRYTDREREMTKKIRELEEKVRSLQRASSSLSSHSIDTQSIVSYTEGPVMSPARSVGSESEVRKLREQVRMLEERCSALQQKSNIPERDSVAKESIGAEFLERELWLKEKYQKEIDVSENENKEVRNKMVLPSSDLNSQSENDVEGMQAVIDRYDKRYKQLCKDSIMNQQAYSFWSESEAVRVLREDFQVKTTDLEELKTLNQSLQIRCDGLKDEYRVVQCQNNNLIEEREEAFSEKIGLQNELETLQETMAITTERIRKLESSEESLREINERLKFEQESYSVLIEKQTQEISLLKSYETEVKEFRVVSEKLIREQSKEKELMAIIQTLEDQNSYLQSEVQLKNDKVSDLTSVISNLTEKLKVYRNSEMNELNGNEGTEVLFYPQVMKVNKSRNNNNDNNNNNNNNNGDDELYFETIEETQPEITQELDTESYKSDGEIAPLSLSTADQLSTDSTESSDTRDETSPLSVLAETDKPTDLPCPDLDLSGVSIEEWSHASEEEAGPAPSPPNLSPIPTPDRAARTCTPDLFLVRYNYDPLVSSPNPHPEQELPLKAGDCIYIYGKPDEDGFYMGELNGGKRGLVPSNFVERVPPPPLTGSHNDDFTKDSLTPSRQEDRGAIGPLGLYPQEPNQLNSPYETNLSNIVEEDESLLDESYLTRVSATITSTESMDRCGTGENSSTESLDKITDVTTPVASPRHIPETADLKVKYTEQDVELTWAVPPHTQENIQGYHVSIGSEITHYIPGVENTFLSVSSLEDKLTPGRYTLVICTVTNHGYSDPVECTIDTTVVAPPTELCLSEDGACLLISWTSPDTITLSSPLVSFTVYLNETILTSVDYSDFLLNRGVSVPRNEFLKFYQSTPDQHILLTVQSFLSNGRFSIRSEQLEVPLRFITRSGSSGRMTTDTESSEECSRHSSSSESEVLEVFRKSSLQTDQLLQGRSTPIHEFAEVVSKPPLDLRPERARQSFTPNEEDLFTELEAQGESGLSQEMFSIQQTSSQSDSDNSDEIIYADIPPLDASVSYYVALYDYNPVQDSPNKSEYQTELPLKKGEVVAVFGEVDEEGFFNGQVATQVGLVPYNLVEKIKLCEVSGETSSALLFQATKQAFPERSFTALYSYNPRTDSPNSEDLDDELSFKSGASISIFGDVQDDGFYIGERDGELGFVPSNFIEPADHVKPQDVEIPSHESSISKGATQVENLRTNKTILAKTKGIFKSLSKKS